MDDGDGDSTRDEDHTGIEGGTAVAAAAGIAVVGIGAGRKLGAAMKH